MIYIIIPKGFTKRFINFFLKSNIQAIEEKDGLLRLDTDDLSFVLEITKEDFVNRYISRIFFVNKKIEDVAKIPNNNKTTRVQVYPKKKEQDVLEILDKNNFSLSPTDFEEVLSIVFVNGCYYGYTNKNNFFVKTQEKQVARAYYKIKQIVCEENIDVKNKIILDIGAAPGGWSKYLKDFAKQIIAVDPANLEISSNNIIHFKNKLEDVVAQINTYDYDIIICDINDEFFNVVENIFKLKYVNKTLIMTLKFSRKNKKAIEKEIIDIQEHIKKYSKEVRFFWLFANTKYERTLICKF